MFLNTYIDQMQMVTCENNHSKSLVNRTLGQKTGAVCLTVPATVMCSVQGIAVSLPQFGREVS